MKEIGVITTSRADYGIWRPVLRAMDDHPDLSPKVYITGSHLLSAHGRTAQQIERDGYPIAAYVEGLLAGDSPQAISKAMGVTCSSFAQLFANHRPDILFALGDRFEMFAAVLAALPFNIPIAHLHGGEVTEGAIDDALRHGITKMSHLHFVATPRYAKRIVQLGEEPWRVTVSGAPALDHVLGEQLATRAEVEEFIGATLDRAPLVVTYHPVTRHGEERGRHAIKQFTEGLASWDGPIVITQTNADTFHGAITREIDAFVASRPQTYFVGSLGIRRYFRLLSIAAAMVGNSSSGIIEAASFELPVVNVGERQRGRDHGENVLHVAADARAISEAIKKATSDAFRASLEGMKNPYGSGHAGTMIAETLAQVSIDEVLTTKRFFDMEPSLIKLSPSKSEDPHD